MEMGKTDNCVNLDEEVKKKKKKKKKKTRQL